MGNFDFQYQSVLSVRGKLPWNMFSLMVEIEKVEGKLLERPSGKTGFIPDGKEKLIQAYLETAPHRLW